MNNDNHAYLLLK